MFLSMHSGRTKNRKKSKVSDSVTIQMVGKFFSNWSEFSGNNKAFDTVDHAIATNACC